MNPTEFVRENILDQKFLGDTVFEWLLFGAFWLAGCVVLIGLHRLLAWRMGAISKRTVNVFDDYLTEIIRRTRLYFLIAAALMIAVNIATLATRTSYWIGSLCYVVFMIQLLIWANGTVDQWIKRYREQRLETDAAAVTTVQAIGFLLRIVIYSIVFLVTLDHFGADITALVAGLGVGGVSPLHWPYRTFWATYSLLFRSFWTNLLGSVIFLRSIRFRAP